MLRDVITIFVLTLSVDWVRAVVQEGEDAYLQMTYEEGIAALTSDGLVGNWDALVDMSLNP